MSDAPPILVPPGAKNPFRTIARISWIAPLTGLALNFLLVIGSGGKPTLSNALLSLVFIGGGLLLGVIALFGIPKYGRKGILIPALIGIGIPVALFVLCMLGLIASLILFISDISLSLKALWLELPPEALRNAAQGSRGSGSRKAQR